MAELTFAPDYGSPQSKEPVVNVASFGDNYEQRTARGINNIARMWQVVFTRSKADIDAIDAFLTARGAVESFDMTIPGYNPGRYRALKWSSVELDSGTVQLNVEIKEVFGE